MKCRSLFSEKNKKNIINLLTRQSVVQVKSFVVFFFVVVFIVYKTCIMQVS